MPEQQIAQVYVERAVYAIDRPFDYLVPEEMAQTLRRGCRVLVPFGNSNRKVQGLVVSVTPETGFDGKRKPVAAQLDAEPVVTEEMFRLLSYLVEHTFCTWYEAVRVLLPVGSNVDVVEYYTLCRRPTEEELAEMSAPQKKLLEFLEVARTARELGKFLDCRQNPSKSAAVRPLLEREIVAKSDRLKSRVTGRTVRLVRLSDECDLEAIHLPPRQREVAELLRDVGTAEPKELAYLCGVTDSVVRALIKKGVLMQFEREADPIRSGVPSGGMAGSGPELSPAQQAVFDELQRLRGEGRACAALLHGITGSGKTQIYLKLIDALLAEGKTALLLVPEIALTPQLVDTFAARFGDIIGVIHSNLTVAERLEEYRRIRSGIVKIVIGTRSAVFAPLQQLGAVILDEEGEMSYKSESTPRYHARDIAKLRCAEWKALLLLGSATPSIDSYYRAQQGKYRLLTLKERYAAAQLPQVYLVDMKQEREERNLSPLSRVLQEQLAENLRAGEQSILLINRRGYHTYATCMQCGAVIKCPDCSVAMTYHRVNGCLMCHYCGHTEKFSPHCPDCGGEYIKLTGTGTQKVEEEIAALFPQARLLRMDADTTGSRYAYERKFDAFRRREYDILLGTQMVAKGLDFPEVTLVGVLHADGGLYTGDYRSSERVFSLITQVVGRGGRGHKPGRAYIQTFDPENPILHHAACQDYEAFYEDEIALRKAMLLPPFCDVLILGASAPEEEMAGAAAGHVLAVLREESEGREQLAMKVLGAAPAPVYKLAGKYRWRVVVKCRMNAAMRRLTSDVLRRCGRELPSVTLYADVNGEMG